MHRQKTRLPTKYHSESNFEKRPRSGGHFSSRFFAPDDSIWAQHLLTDFRPAFAPPPSPTLLRFFSICLAILKGSLERTWMRFLLLSPPVSSFLVNASCKRLEAANAHTTPTSFATYESLQVSRLFVLLVLFLPLFSISPAVAVLIVAVGRGPVGVSDNRLQDEYKCAREDRRHDERQA